MSSSTTIPKDFFLVPDVRREILLFLHPSDCKGVLFSCRKWGYIYLGDSWYWHTILDRYFTHRLRVHREEDKPRRISIPNGELIELPPMPLELDEDYHRKMFNREMMLTSVFRITLDHGLDERDWFNVHRMSQLQSVLLERGVGSIEPFLSTPIEFEAPENVGQVVSVVFRVNATLLDRIGEVAYSNSMRATFIGFISLFYMQSSTVTSMFQRMIEKANLTEAQVVKYLLGEDHSPETLSSIVDYVSHFHSISDNLFELWQEMHSSSAFRVISDIRCELRGKTQIVLMMSFLEDISDEHPFDFFAVDMRRRLVEGPPQAQHDEILERELYGTEDHPSVDVPIFAKRCHTRQEFEMSPQTFLSHISKQSLTSTGSLSVMMLQYVNIQDLYHFSPQLFQFLCLLAPQINTAFVSDYPETQQVGVHFGDGKRGFPLFSWYQGLENSDSSYGSSDDDYYSSDEECDVFGM